MGRSNRKTKTLDYREYYVGSLFCRWLHSNGKVAWISEQVSWQFVRIYEVELGLT